MSLIEIPLVRPGDYLRPDDEEAEGFKARLNERLAPVGSQFSGEGVNDDWEIGDTLAQWWRPNFETFMYPFLPGHVTRPKECKKLYFIQLPKKSESTSNSEQLTHRFGVSHVLTTAQT
jgi:cleavage and polyadenylation specificity factor subunit 5